MTKFTGKRRLAAAMACAAMVLIGAGGGGCESKMTTENFAKIKKGMTLAEVQTILGSSGEEDSSPTGMTISGAGIGGSSKESKEKIYVWKEEGATITVVIVDGKVVEARQAGL